MRTFVLGAGIAGVGAAVLGLQACGTEADSCTFDLTCDPGDASVTDVTVDGKSDGSVPDGGGDAADAGSDVHDPPDAGPCSADAGSDPYDGCYAVDGTGIFVNAHPDGGTGPLGKQANPFTSINAAIAALKASGTTRIYVCNGVYPETVTFDNSLAVDVQIFGHLSCTKWAWDKSGVTHVAPTNEGYALSIAGTKNKISIEGLNFEALKANGYNDAGAGRSSIAAFVNGATNDVVLASVEIHPDDGYPGQTFGNASPDYTGLADGGIDGTGSAGGGDQPSAIFLCQNGSGQTQGARGGAPNGSGSQGYPGTAPPQPSSDFNGHAGSAGSSCGSGGGGGDGAFGDAGVTGSDGGGLGATEAGVLASSGWQPGNGLAGVTGAAGQGGGGGAGGSTGGGGGGGQGGCGGTGGLPGTGGGASIGLLIYNSPSVKLTRCTVSSGAGGAGGAGGKGQNGQQGGVGGNRAGNGCTGGNGGTGGAGSGGGGGAGGTSVAVGYVGPAAPTIDNSNSITPGKVGQKGVEGAGGGAGSGSPGGNPGQPGTPGADGIFGGVVALPGN